MNNIQFPKHITAREYYEFDSMLDTLEQFGIKDAKYEEIGFDVTGSYHAVFFIGDIDDSDVIQIINKIGKYIDDLDGVNDDEIYPDDQPHGRMVIDL